MVERYDSSVIPVIPFLSILNHLKPLYFSAKLIPLPPSTGRHLLSHVAQNRSPHFAQIAGEFGHDFPPGLAVHDAHLARDLEVQALVSMAISGT